jgi:hypothetical protein
MDSLSAVLAVLAGLRRRAKSPTVIWRAIMPERESDFDVETGWSHILSGVGVSLRGLCLELRQYRLQASSYKAVGVGVV